MLKKSVAHPKNESKHQRNEPKVEELDLSVDLNSKMNSEEEEEEDDEDL